MGLKDDPCGANLAKSVRRSVSTVQGSVLWISASCHGGSSSSDHATLFEVRSSCSMMVTAAGERGWCWALGRTVKMIASPGWQQTPCTLGWSVSVFA